MAPGWRRVFALSQLPCKTDARRGYQRAPQVARTDTVHLHWVAQVTVKARLVPGPGPIGHGVAATTGYPLLDRIAPISHYGFYVLVVLMVATGFATGILAGLPAIVFGGSGAPLPSTFMIFPTFVAHGWLAALLAGFIVLHVLAAFYHQFVKRDRLFTRMFYGRRASGRAK